MIKQWVSEGFIDSYIEAAYLGVPVTSRGSERFIYVNPRDYRYLIGKVAVISSPDYPPENIKWMIQNGVTVIGRILIPGAPEDFTVKPYIMRVEFRVMWNGDEMNYSSKMDLPAMLRRCSEVENIDTGNPMKVFIPKIYGIPKEYLSDSEGNLTYIGWAMHQVGINVNPDSQYLDLDLLKTKKVLL